MYQAMLSSITKATPFSKLRISSSQKRIGHPLALLFSTAILALLFFPSSLFAGLCDVQNIAFCDDFETDKGWVTDIDYSDSATAGYWERAFPELTREVGYVTYQPGTVVSGIYALVTDGRAGPYNTYDVDYGTTSITSPEITLPASATSLTLDFSYFLGHRYTAGDTDGFSVYMVGPTYTNLIYSEVADWYDQDGEWSQQSLDITAYAGDQIRIRFEATDDSGTTIEAGVDDFIITYLSSNTPPSITSPGNQSNLINDSVSIPVAVSDADSDPVTCSASGLPSGLSINSNSCLISGTIAAGAGNYFVAVSANDGQASSYANFNWTISSGPTAPVATNPGNQSNMEGTGVGLQIQASDANNDPLSYSASGLPYGLSINSSSGLISGTVVNGASESSPFSTTVTVSDGSLSDQVNFIWTVTVQPAGPVEVFYDSFENGAWNGLWTQDGYNDWKVSTQRAVHGNSSAEVDGRAVDSELISIPIDLQGSSQATISFGWYIESYLDNGEYLAFDVSTDGGITWEERARLLGNVDSENTWIEVHEDLAGISNLRLRFRGKMSRASEDANVDDVSVTVPASAINSPPVITSPGDQSTENGGLVSLPITTSDPDGDPVACSAVGLPAGLYINDDSCIIAGTVSASAGAYTVIVTATDGNLSSTVVFNWTITAPPTPPQVTHPGNQNNEEGESVSLQIQATDINNDTLSYAAVGLPPGVTINSSTGLISGTIQSGASISSPFSVTITVDDGELSDAAVFTWTVSEQNLDPLLAIPVTRSNTINNSVWMQVNASDPEGQPLSFAATGLPSGLSIDTNTGLITGTVLSSALGQYSVNLTVSDGVNSIQGSFFWKIYDLNTATEVEYIWVDEPSGQFKLAWRYPPGHIGPTYTTPQYFEVRPGSIQPDGTVFPSNVQISAAVGTLMWQSGTINAALYEGTTYTVRACVTNDACSDTAVVDLLTMDAGYDLLSVAALSIVGLNDEAGTFRLQWTYSDDYFYSSTGTPDHFEIRPALTQPGGDVVITVPRGSSTPSSGWQSATLDDDNYMGATYLVYACFSDGECGEASVITVHRAGIDPDFPQPGWSHGDITTSTDLDFTLSWTLAADERIDYFAITEVGPIGTLVYYTEEQSVYFTRAKDGSYDFSLQACHRDRQFGDSCSTFTDQITVTVPVVANMASVQGLSWYWVDEGAETARVQWQYPANDYNQENSRPDYFYIGVPNVIFDQLAHSVSADNTDGDYTWVSNVMDLGLIWSASRYVSVKACKTGGVCGGWTSIDLSVLPPIATPLAPTEPDVTEPEVTEQVPGGPDDLHPGEWWDPNRKGTGWSFYWASELRYPSIHENYGNTYDLIAFWFNYAKIDGTWRPAWFFAQMKYEDNHFQGALYYARHHSLANPCPNSAATCHEQVGQLALDFGADNVHASVSVQLSKEQDVGLPFVTDLQIDLDYFANPDLIDTGIIESAYDHFSGMWWHTNGGLDEDFAVLHWLDHEHESVVVPFYDSEGRPTWVRGDWSKDDGDPTTDAWHQGFNVLTVDQGFDPTEFTPSGWDLSTHLKPAGSIGRRFDDFREAAVWLNVSDNYGRSANLQKGSISNPYSMEKATSFHDVRFFIGSNDETITECIVATSENCNLTLNWFTDNYYPDATVFLRNLTTNTASLVGSDYPTVIDHQFAFSGTGTYQFELWKKNSTTFNSPTGNAMIAESQVITVTETGVAGTPEIPPAPAPAPSMAPDALSSAVGATAGQFRVNETGHANYSIPLLTAPGSGGVAPQISVDYSSGNSNGLLGVGWSLGGLSVITRCAQTAEQDPSSTMRGVTLTGQDRFCLDGQRLILASGVYGETGAEYRTEIDAISKVVSYNSAGTGPQYFRVWRKDGSVTEYGNSEDSRIEARLPSDSATVFAWAQNRFEDSAGNFILYQYEENTSGPVEFVLDYISYTGNASAGTEPYAVIDFIYSSNRADGTTAYVAGAAFGQSKLLSRIDSKAKALSTDSTYTPLRSYLLTYDALGDGHGRQIISSIQECDDSALSHCFVPTTFDWLKSDHEFSTSASPGFSLPQDLYGIQLADVNGDGRPDLLYTEKSGSNFYLKIAQATSTGGFIAVGNPYLIPEVNPDKPVAVYTIDLNVDGFQDVVYPKNVSGIVTWYARLSTGAGLNSETGLLDSTGSLNPVVVQVMDYDGDGLSDLLHSRSNPPGKELVVLRNTFTPGGIVGFDATPQVISFDVQGLFPEEESGWLLNDELPLFGLAAQTRQAKVFDYNGDGAVDLLVKVSRQYCQGICNTEQVPVVQQGSGTGTSVFEIENLSDDSVASAAHAEEQSGDETATVAYWLIYESDRQGGYVRREVVARDGSCELSVICDDYILQPMGSDFQPIDINSDGLADLVYRDDSGMWHYKLNTGSSFLAGQEIGQPLIGLEDAVLLRDVNGDGFVDFLYPNLLDDDAAMWQLQLNDFGNGFAAVMATSGKAGDSSENDISLFVDFTGDGKLDQFFVNLESGSNPVSQFRKGINGIEPVAGVEASNFITRIINGFGAETEITYKPLTDTSVYSRMRDSSNADWSLGSVVYDLVAPVYVVSEAASSAPLLNNAQAVSHIEYHYVGAKLQGGGRGFLGFGEVITYDPQSGIRTNTRYRQDHPYIGLPQDTTQALVTSTHKLRPISNLTAGAPPTWPTVNATTAAPSLGASGTLLSYAVNEWAARTTVAGAQFLYIVHSLERSNSLAGSFSRKLLTSNTYADDFGNLENVIIQTYDADGSVAVATQTTANTYSDSVNNWFLGRLASSTVSHARAGRATITRKSTFAYDSATGILHQEVIEPNNSAYKVTTNYTLDQFGNRTAASVVGKQMAPRTSVNKYDNLGRFVTETINAYGQSTSEIISWDAYGNPLLVADINGVTTISAADHMGRVFISYTQTGAWSKTINRAGAGGHCPVSTVFYTLSTSGGGPDQYQCFDLLGREIRSATQGFDGSMIRIDRHYDESGRAAGISEPHYAGANVYWNISSYDELGRILMLDSATGDDLMYGYDENAASNCVAGGVRRVLTTNGLGQERLELKNALGETTAVYDNNCALVSYDFDSVGSVIEVIGADGVAIQMDYDLTGRKIAMDDPDKGYWEYAYNPLGELTRQLDSQGQATDFEYDLLGRVTNRYEQTDANSLGDPSTTLVNHELTHYENGAGSGRGQPLWVEYRAADGSVLQRHDYIYDGFGRSDTVSTTIGTEQFAAQTTYDECGRLFQQFDASGDDHGLRYVYNTQGYLEQMKEAREGVSGAVYQDIQAMDARGQVTYLILGNGVEAFASYQDVSGRLQRLEAYKGAVELQEVDYLFDVLGNLTQRHDRSTGKDLLEEFAYDGMNRLTGVDLTAPLLGISTPIQTLSMTYSLSGNISYKSDVGSYSYGNNAGPHAVTSAGGVSYSYDVNGNQTSGDGRTITYTVFDKPDSISKGTAETQFSYGIANTRYQRVDLDSSVVQKITLYLGSTERISEGSSTYFKRYLGGVAIATFYPNTGVQQVQYLLKDHIGSIHTVTNNTGQIVATMHFGAFGERQGDNWQSALSSFQWTALNDITTQGFTGHEQVDEMGIVHMNGRIYDPKLGRMLQADPFVQAPKNSQSLNRYTYVLNNPLSYTDPSGYFSFKSLWKKVIRPILATAVFIVGMTFAPEFAPLWGALSGFIATGNIKGAVIGAFAGAAFGALGAQAAAAEGGGSAWASLGRDALGLLLAHAQQSPMDDDNLQEQQGRKIRLMTIGGTNSGITAGKFVNGADTFSYSYSVGSNLSLIDTDGVQHPNYDQLSNDPDVWDSSDTFSPYSNEKEITTGETILYTSLAVDMKFPGTGRGLILEALVNTIINAYRVNYTIYDLYESRKTRVFDYYKNAAGQQKYIYNDVISNRKIGRFYRVNSSMYLGWSNLIVNPTAKMVPHYCVEEGIVHNACH